MSAIGSLSHLAGCTRPDASMTVHQASKFWTEPKACHNAAVKLIGKYLLGTAEDCLAYELDDAKGLEIFVDVDFAGGFDTANAEDPELAHSSTGFMIQNTGCPNA